MTRRSKTRLAKALGLGNTGNYSRGKMNENDEGDIRIAIANNGHEVILDFGEPVAWLGLEPDKAEIIAAALLDHAKQVRAKAQ